MLTYLTATTTESCKFSLVFIHEQNELTFFHSLLSSSVPLHTMSLARIVIFMIAVLAHGRQGEGNKTVFLRIFSLHMSL
jgi:hypothetical protein